MTGHSERGVVLVLVLLSITFVAAGGLALVLSTSLSRMSAANAEEAAALVNAADAGLAIAARELAMADVSAVLDGSQVSPYTDGAPGPRTVAPGVTIDLNELTNRLSCGAPAACTTAQIQEVSSERPWGMSNPRWRLFLHQAMAPPALPHPAQSPYVVVWIGDDAREVDGDPELDGAGPEQEGRYIVRARAEAFGARHGRRAIEAELTLRCLDDPAGDVCLPGSRVHSWRVLLPPVP